jgi:excinuclease ABC subunit B
MHPDRFQLVSDFQPRGDQPAAIESLVSGIERGEKHQTLLGATGTGKTFTMANVIAQVNKPTLVISHNKTLAAQLYEEFRELFPDNAVCYFVSYYDYYQPEAYIPARDIYIEKDASRNDDLDRLRLAATSNLIGRRDVIVVASVSCIFGLGSPGEYKKNIISISRGQMINRRDLLASLTDLQYKRTEFEFQRGNFRVRGDVIEVFVADAEFAYRIELFGDEVESLQYIDPISGEVLADEKQIFIYPAVHYMMDPTTLERATDAIRQELDEQVMKLRHEGMMLEAQRLLARTKYDIEMIKEIGYCSGVENYSRHLDGRPAGSKPSTLLNYFDVSGEMGKPGDSPGPQKNAEGSEGGNKDWLLMIDESHVTLPQMRAMYAGDKARKKVLVEHGFRLPSAMDNRPLTFEEIEKSWQQVVFVTATPGPYELEKTGGEVAEQVIRPTGLLDPVIEIQPAASQVPHLLEIAMRRKAKGERTLVTTLTKRLAEDLSRYLDENGVKCRYLHSDIETLDRVEILRELREGKFDVLVGVNLLREGLDLPEVSLVGIMDADKAGFLRSATSLIQQIGRAARNVNATVILYADEVTPAMKQAIDETNRRRVKQMEYNQANNITPKTIEKEIRRGIEMELRARDTARKAVGKPETEYDTDQYITELEKQMLQAAERLEFEKAAMLRDKMKQIKASPVIGKVSGDDDIGPPPGTPGTRTRKKRKRKGP